MTTALYELSLAGSITTDQRQEIEKHIIDGIEPFGFKLGNEVAWSVNNLANFNPSKKIGAAVAFFGAENVSTSEPILNFVCRGHIMLTQGAMNDRSNEETAQAQTYRPVFQRTA